MPHSQDDARDKPLSRRARRLARQAEAPQEPGFYATGIDAAATGRIDVFDLERQDAPASAQAPGGADAAPATQVLHTPRDAGETPTTRMGAVGGAADATPTQRFDAPTQLLDAPRGESAAPPSAPPPGKGAKDKGDGSRRRRIRIGVLIGIAVLVIAGLWLGARVLIVKSELEAAQRVVNHVQDGGTLEVSVPILGEHAANAASVSVDPVWRLAEFIPWAGDNLRGVRLAAEALDVVSNRIGQPALEAMSSDSGESIIARVLPLLQDSTDDVVRIAEGIADVKDAGTLIPPVQTGVNLVDSVMSVAAPAFEYGPELLGANGARNYLLVFQNNAESVGLGGSAASQTLMSADAGNLQIVNQASSADFTEFVPVDVDVDQSALDLYNEYLIHHVNTSPSRPDFPTMAEIVTKFWQRDISDDRIDGVASIDPIALGYILEATGPIQLTTGDVMTSQNAAQLLLSDVYSRFDSVTDPAAADEFFASVAEQVFTKVSAGDFDIQSMLWAIRHGIEGGNILFHSQNEDVQKQIADEKVAGILPKDNDEQTTLGVFFRDESASKIDYYMKSNIDVTQTCQADASTFEVRTTLHLDIDQATADALPQYVKSQTDGTRFHTQVYVYGPPGTTVESVAVEGEEVTLRRDDVVDLGRPVAWFTTVLDPSELATVTATFSGEGEFGPLALRSTPMVQATTGALTACG
ncbi:hypothetical protein GCM10017576_08160 [Microbacterium barkeri]|uniref:DUF4012 domain-containing protein n=1 Tax=Microbacterium barkeri TaxID=33917 RepID=A0A9W6LVU1_9MICO|nr:DUF4012 domain-containing protein [Microbacterium barkeri]MDR6875153.1 hypothetical protein [Microbacterium barkeri]GLJ60687.1 hypothetical protein GCM10017576_08160 [Microbacterium barkeri]